MLTLARISGCSIGGSVVAIVSPPWFSPMTASTTKDAVIAVPAELAKALARAGIERAGADGRITSTQLDTLLGGRDLSNRIKLKSMVERAGIYPRG
jgi:hypothetical protein